MMMMMSLYRSVVSRRKKGTAWRVIMCVSPRGLDVIDFCMCPGATEQSDPCPVYLSLKKVSRASQTLDRKQIVIIHSR
jgi:hypothetical protein